MTHDETALIAEDQVEFLAKPCEPRRVLQEVRQVAGEAVGPPN